MGIRIGIQMRIRVTCMTVLKFQILKFHQIHFRDFKNRSWIFIYYFVFFCKPQRSKFWNFWYLKLFDFQVVYERNLSKHRPCIDIEQWLLVRLDKWIFTMYQILWWGSSVHIQALHPSQVSSLDCLRNKSSKIIIFTSRVWDIITLFFVWEETWCCLQYVSSWSSKLEIKFSENRFNFMFSFVSFSAKYRGTCFLAKLDLLQPPPSPPLL